MKLVSMTPSYTGYIPYASYVRQFTLRFRPKNPFSYARITTSFFEIILSCSITKGLLDKDEN